MAAAGFDVIIRALKNPNYGIYTAGSSISLIGTWMQRIATGWLAWELTGSGAWLGLIAFADLFPTVIIGPFAGALADRWDRLTVTKVGQSLALCQALALLILTLTGQMTIWLLLGLVAFLGSVAAFNQPARLALIHSLVPREDLTAAVALNSVVFNLARFIGPAIAGVLIVSFGIAAAFAANVISFLLFLTALSRIRLKPLEPSDKQRRGIWHELKEGISYTLSHQGIAAILLLLMATSIGGRPVIELLPGFASKIFDAGAGGLAILTSSIGVGAIISGLWLSRRGHSVGLTKVVCILTLLLASSVIAFTATSSLWAAVPALVVFGFTVAGAGISTQILLQLAVDGAMRGRVLSLYGLIFRGGPAIGALIMGVASEYFGLRLPVFAGAVLVILAALWVWIYRDRIAERLEPGQT